MDSRDKMHHKYAPIFCCPPASRGECFIQVTVDMLLAKSMESRESMDRTLPKCKSMESHYQPILRSDKVDYFVFFEVAHFPNLMQLPDTV